MYIVLLYVLCILYVIYCIIIQRLHDILDIAYSRCIGSVLLYIISVVSIRIRR